VTRILTLDIETSPNVCHTWGLFNVNVGLSQLVESGRVLCVAAKWHDEKRVQFFAEWQEGGRHQFLSDVYHLLDEADVVVGWNSIKFDVPHLMGEFMRQGWTPPAPFLQIDLCAVARRNFRLTSNKLAYVASEILGDSKQDTGGHGLWTAVLAGDPKAQAKMRRYCMHDTRLTDQLFDRLRPWVKNLPNPYVHDDVARAKSCPDCGSESLEKRGTAYTAVSQYPRYRCRDCGRWSRGTRRHFGAQIRGAA
jgi:hypothetical protein